MQKIWLSPKLYRLLPVAYLFSGLLMITKFGEEPLGIISGAMLCAAAILIWALRAHGSRGTITDRQKEQ